MGEFWKILLDLSVLFIAVVAMVLGFRLAWKMTAFAPEPKETPASEPDSLLPFLSDNKPPRFTADVITIQNRLGNEFLEVKLKNQGGTVLFDHLLTRPNNQLQVKFLLPNRTPLESGMVIGQGDTLALEMYGNFVISKIYQFQLVLHDLAGNRYRLEFEGLGIESPLIEQAEMVRS